MPNLAGSKDDAKRWKPEGFEKYLTISELARLVNRDVTRLRALDYQGILPKPARAKVGRLSVRLYSPEVVRQISAYFRASDKALAAKGKGSNGRRLKKGGRSGSR